MMSRAVDGGLVTLCRGKVEPHERCDVVLLDAVAICEGDVPRFVELGGN
jgi:hypothetical protein